MIITNTEKLKELMTRKGFTGAGFARATKISQCYIVQILQGKRTILAPIAKKICDTLECDFDEIFTIGGGKK